MSSLFEVMVIGRPSRFRDSISLLLTSISQITEIHLACDIASAVKHQAPAAVVLDAEGLGLTVSINQIKIAWPLAGIIVLVEDEQEFQAAAAIGGVVPLRKGFPAAKFIDAVESRLSH